MSVNETLLRIEGLSAAYGKREVVSDVSIEQKAGEIVCIVGESGSGKSSLIKAIHGMSDIEIRRGSVIFDGTKISELSAPERRKLMGSGIGLIPQDPAASFNPIRKLEPQFKEALFSHDMKYDQQHIGGILAGIGLERGSDILGKRPYELSGGMNQRIAIAAAMMFEPRLLLCDEATSALDVTTAGTVVDELMKIRDERNTAIMMVTHHLGIAKMMADSIGIMKDGRIIEYGSADEVFGDPKNDYTQRLIRDVPRLKR